VTVYKLKRAQIELLFKNTNETCVHFRLGSVYRRCG